MTEVVVTVSVPPDLPADLLETMTGGMYWLDEGVTSASLAPGRLTVSYCGRLPEERIRELVTAEVGRLVGSAADQPAPWFDGSSLGTARSPGSDPLPLLTDRGWAVEEAPGTWLLSGPLARLHEAADRLICDRLLSHGAEPVSLPSLLSPGNLRRSGYFESNAAAVNYVFHLREGRDTLAGFGRANAGRQDDALALESVPSTAAQPDAVLSPAACLPYLRSLRGRILDRLSMVTGRARVFRYESGATAGLRRSREFTVREAIVAGNSEQVQERRLLLLSVARSLVSDVGLACRIVPAADPFFATDLASLRRYQLAFGLKHEIRADLPFDGSSLAIGSVNLHRDHFGLTWQAEAAGEPAWSCCMGFGLERFIFAVCAQFGAEPSDWPAVLR